jgi:hypothetical protein
MLDAAGGQAGCDVLFALEACSMQDRSGMEGSIQGRMKLSSRIVPITAIDAEMRGWCWNGAQLTQTPNRTTTIKLSGTEPYSPACQALSSALDDATTSRAGWEVRARVNAVRPGLPRERHARRNSGQAA